jgi:transcriptional antiterminator RfaH
VLSAAIGNSDNCLTRWHLVLTKPGGELLAKSNLERQEYRVYFPRVRQKLLRRGAWREVISALFPRYMFVQLNSAVQSLAPMRSTLGVANVVRFGAEFTTVPDAIVEDLIGREDESGLHRLSSAPLFKAGAAVDVLDGALAGVSGVFEREDGDDRVVVLLNLLGRESRINLPMASIAPSAIGRD